jgi:hypothetical protein
VQKIESFVQHYNRKTRTFAWTATADSILSKISRRGATQNLEFDRRPGDWVQAIYKH